MKEPLIYSSPQENIEDLRVAATTKQYDSAIAVSVYRPFILISFLSNGTYSKTVNTSSQREGKE